jgi:hypothetical protein
MPSRCRYVRPSCRKLARGRKAKSPCTKTINGQNVDGTTIRGHSRPKKCLDKQVTQIQSLARAQSARRSAKARLNAIRTIQSYGKRMKSGNHKTGGGKGGPVRKSGRAVKARARLIEE